MKTKLEELLKKEEEAYAPILAFTRHFASHIRGLDKHFPPEAEMKMHLDACRDFYNMFGSTTGENSPWLTKEG